MIQKKSTSLPVRTIQVTKDTALVEWVDKDETSRGFIPFEMIEDGKVDTVMLEAALPYGLSFEGFEPVLVEALHKTGIYTAQDVLTNRQGLVDAISVSIVRPVIETLTDYAIKNK